jgi:putative transposase
MHFEDGYLYHVYNQGNNGRQVFFDSENYLYFIEKLRHFVLPHADIIAWCLMPNHFHLMLYLHSTHAMIQSHSVSKTRDLNNSIGILLRSYTRAINKKKGFTGKLFREGTKAQCIDCPTGITSSFLTINGIPTIFYNSEMEYPQVCFNYIHNNPVKAGLVKDVTDWEYSSAAYYADQRAGTIVNKERALEYVIW